jgi:hypothetical protein
LNLPHRYFTDIYYYAGLTDQYQRGIHDIHRPFVFRSNPGFIFHDSPGFETGDEKQLHEVLSFIEKKEKSKISCMPFGQFRYLSIHTRH